MDKELQVAMLAPPGLSRPGLSAGALSASEGAACAELGLTPERARYEREQAYFNELYLLAPVGYFVLGFDSTILQMNIVGANWLGLQRNGGALLLFRQFVAPRFLSDFDRFLRDAANTSEPQRCDVQLSSGGPAEPGFAATLRASADGSGQAIRVVLEPAAGNLAALEQSEARFRRIVHSAEEGIWEIDAQARTAFVNPRMAAMLGYSIEDILGQPLVAFMDDEGRALVDSKLVPRRQGVAERHEYKFVRKDGQVLWTTLTSNPILDHAGACVGALVLVRDITASRQSAELIWQQANFDQLTALPNRHMFHDRLAQEMKKARREGLLLALLFIDLDGFKLVNDTFGHEQGDALLVAASGRIADCIRASDTLARLGGDEFVAIIAGLDHASSVDRVAQNIITALQQPFRLDGGAGCVSASLGIALFPSDASDAAELVRHADQAMYAAKHAGRNRYHYFTPDLQQAAQRRQRLSADLRHALAEGQFELYYQPIVNLNTGMIERAEALLRWRHPERGLLHPPDFMPYAVSSGLIVEIGDWVFRRAAEQVRQWQLELGRPFQVSINQSPAQFRGAGAGDWLEHVEKLGLAPRSIVIDVTENVLLDDAAEVLQRLRHYRAMGLQVALDDFGTGYGSMAHLRKFDIDFIKIDRSLLRDMVGDSGDLALCEALIVMAHKLGLKVVAEGVETPAQQALLVAAGCDYAQGYVFAHAVPASKFTGLARNGLPQLP